MPDSILWEQGKPQLILTKEELIELANYLRNQYLPQEEPIRTIILKIHNTAARLS
jgi:hypothetical protein